MTAREQLDEYARIGRKYEALDDSTYEPPHQELLALAERLLDAIEAAHQKLHEATDPDAGIDGVDMHLYGWGMRILERALEGSDDDATS
jgi:hypothetical protein